MKQVYNLLETIEQDKEAVAKLKKQLHHAESILEAHTAALIRLTTIPELSQPKVGKVDYSPAVETRERITWSNWNKLGINKEDKVEIVNSTDEDFTRGTYLVTNLEDHAFTGTTFVELDDIWYDYGRCRNLCGEDELYLIRTEEGSLND